MPYYQGDYYQGDYYRGDPFALPMVMALGGLARKVVPSLVRTVGKKIFAAVSRPGVARTVAAAAGTAVMMRPSVTPRAMNGFAGPVPGGPPLIAPPSYKVQPTPGFKGRVQRFLPGGATGYEYVKRRRMNVTNPKALRRAIRRATGFAKLARRVLTFVQAKAPKGRARFKTKRR